METFAKLFGSLLAFVYHCFDRIVILGHLPLLTRPENIVHFFRDVHPTGAITKEVLRKRTTEYHRWVEAFARNRKIPVEWAGKGVRKEDYVRPHLQRMERQNRFGVYCIRKSMEVGPTFRSSTYSIQQVEYCRNLIFRRNFPIHKLFERSCDIGLLRLTPDKITQIFGFRIYRKWRGKLQSVLEKMEHGHHVFRTCGKNAVLRMYEKFTTFLRLEALSNNLKDFGLRKSLDYLEAVGQTLAAVTDRCAAFEAEARNVHVDFPLFQRWAWPIPAGRSKVPGIKIHDTRRIRLMEVLLHCGTKIGGWRTAEIHQAIRTAFSLRDPDYTLTQLRYDLRKRKAHGLLERDGKRYAYRLTAKGHKIALLFVLFHKRVCGPLANSLFHAPPKPETKPATNIEAAYRKADQSIQEILQLLAA